MDPLSEPVPATLVVGTLSYQKSLLSMPWCAWAGAEWGGHSPRCAPPPPPSLLPPLVSPVPGALCGPVVPHFGTVTCSWVALFPGLVDDIGLAVGFDINGDGRIYDPEYIYAAPGIALVGTLVGGTMTVTNPTPPGRAIAFPTSMGSDALDPTEVHVIACA